MLAMVAVTTSCSNDEDDSLIEEGATGMVFNDDDNTPYFDSIGFPWEEYGIKDSSRPEEKGELFIVSSLPYENETIGYYYIKLFNWPVIYIGKYDLPFQKNDEGTDIIYNQGHAFLPLFGADFEAAMSGEDMSYIKDKYFNTNDKGYITSLRPEGAQYVRGSRICSTSCSQTDYKQWNLYWTEKTEFFGLKNLILPEAECQKETGRKTGLTKAQKNIVNEYNLPGNIPWHNLRNLPLMKYVRWIYTSDYRDETRRTYIDYASDEEREEHGM